MAILLIENVVHQLLSDHSMRSGGVYFWALVESGINCIEARGKVAAHIEPPVADKNRLRELRSIRTEEGGLASINIAIMPT